MHNGLNFLLEHVNTALMIEEAPWRTVELICNDLKKLNVTARAILVDAIQKRGIRHNANAESLIKRLFLESEGEVRIGKKTEPAFTLKLHVIPTLSGSLPSPHRRWSNSRT